MAVAALNWHILNFPSSNYAFVIKCITAPLTQLPRKNMGEKNLLFIVYFEITVNLTSSAFLSLKS